MTSPQLSPRTFIGGSLGMAALPCFSFAQDSRPIEWVVGYAAGGGSDVVPRTVGDAMSKTMVQIILINNKPGAATPQQMASYVKTEGEPWGKLIQANGIKLD